MAATVYPSFDTMVLPKAAMGGQASWVRDLLVISLLAGLWFCALLGMRPLSNPDEGRYTEIPGRWPLPVIL
jgi:hypothetical protein